MSMSNFSHDELKIIFDSLYYFAVNSDYKDFDNINHLSENEIEEITISLRQKIDREITRREQSND